jgi:outer membrane receptor protein involved in Fe transport
MRIEQRTAAGALRLGARLRCVVLGGCLLGVLGGSPPEVGAQSPLEVAARLTVEGQGIEQALRMLGRSAGVSLVYSPDLLPASAGVSCACQGVSVRQALERILEGTGLTFRSSGKLIRIVPLQPRSASARNGCILGRVMDEVGAPVVNAMIQLDDGRGVLSDAAGRFVLSGVPAGTRRLRVTSVGWEAALIDEVRVVEADTARVTVRLVRQPIPLPEILVAPGTFSILEDISPGAVQALTREEIQTMPQVGEDVFRSLKRLPGVASHDISTRLNIRGGRDGEVAVQLDGLELYEPYHMKDWDGALGIIDLNALGGVELTAGGFGVEYGEKMTGILDMKSRTELGDTRTTVGLSVTNVNAMSGGGFGDGKGSWLVSARRGFMGLLIRLIGEDRRLSPQYWDVFGRVSWQPDNHNLISAHVLHARDDFGLHAAEDLDAVDVDTGWGSSYAWLSWKATPHARVRANTVASVGRVTRERGGFVEDYGRAGMADRIMARDDREFSFLGLRHDLSFELTDRAMLKVGAELKGLSARYAYASSAESSVLAEGQLPGHRVDSVEVHLAPEGQHLGAYLAARVRPVDRLTAEAGVRYDRVSHAGDEDVSPRVLASMELDPATTLRTSWGRYYQSQWIHELEVGDGETGFYPAERADQVALGLEHRLASGIDARIELYHRSIEDQRPRFINLEQELQIFPEAEGDRLRLDPERGRARGLEVMVERRAGARWAWSASYVLAVAEDEVPSLVGNACGLGQACAEGRWVPRRYDQRHAVAVNVAYRPQPSWDISWGWRYHSGWPATSWTYDATVLEDGSVFWQRIFGPLRAERLPAYHRLDLRVTRELTLHGNPLQVYLDVFNLYNRTNLASFAYDGWFSEGRMIVTRVDGQTLLPRLPTIGFRYVF